MTCITTSQRLLIGAKRAAFATSISAPLGFLGGRIYAYMKHSPVNHTIKVFTVATIVHTAIFALISGLLGDNDTDTVNQKILVGGLTAGYLITYGVGLPIHFLRKGNSVSHLAFIGLWQLSTSLIAGLFIQIIAPNAYYFGKLKIALLKVEWAKSAETKAQINAQIAQNEAQTKIQAAQSNSQALQVKAQSDLQNAQKEEQSAIYKSIMAQNELQTAQTDLAKAQGLQDKKAIKVAEQNQKSAQSSEEFASLNVQSAKLNVLGAQIKFQSIQDTLQAEILAANAKAQNIQSKACEKQAELKKATIAFAEVQFKWCQHLATYFPTSNFTKKKIQAGQAAQTQLNGGQAAAQAPAQAQPNATPAPPSPAAQTAAPNG